MGINLCLSLLQTEAVLCMMHLYAFRDFLVCKSVTVGWYRQTFGECYKKSIERRHARKSGEGHMYDCINI